MIYLNDLNNTVAINDNTIINIAPTFKISIIIY